MKKIFLICIIILNCENSYAEHKIAYIDLDYVLNNSIVGQAITKHIQKINEKKNNELVLIEKQLVDKENEIIKKKNIIEQIEFEKKVNVLNEEIKEYRKKKFLIKEEVDKKKMKYTKIVLKTLNPIISKYVEDNSITIVFPKKNIIMAKKNLDITNSIMELLNNQLIKIDF
jgi:outer membrane protein